jgi:putative PIN family toxin of toxin-antitoxin system
MVFLQGAARGSGPAAACLSLVEAGFVRLYLSEDVLEEIGDVLTRPEIRKRFPILSSEYVNTFLARLRDIAEMVSSVPDAVTLSRDPKDEKYLNLAVAAGARYLVSRDRDLLELMTELPTNGQTMRERFPHLVILDPVEFLAAVRAGVADSGEAGSAAAPT